MIFKTFDSDIDKWTTKIGTLGIYFHELGNIISNSFQQAKDAAVNPDNSAGFFKTFKNSLLSNTGSNEDYERDNTGKIVTQENIDTYIPKLNEENREHKLDF